MLDDVHVARSRRDPARWFANYTQVPARLSPRFWAVLRALVLVATLGTALLLAWVPRAGLALWWGVAVPLLPLLLVLAPGLWRQVCPMALLNQLPRSRGAAPERELPPALQRAAYPVSIVLFLACVALRAPWLNHDGPLVAAGIAGALLLAFAGGLAFKGRSGWCGTFCPLAPIQRSYGQAPPLLVRNGYCPTCVGCQTHCYDFSPRRTVFDDLADPDPRHGAQRQLFAGLLPGLVIGYGLLGQAPPSDLAAYGAALLGCCCLSAGSYALAAAFLPVSAQTLGAVFGATALAAFYWLSAPGMVAALAGLVGAAPPLWAVTAVRATGIAGGGILIGASRHSASMWRALAIPAASGAAPPPAASDVRVTDRETGLTFAVRPGATLLEAIEAAGLRLEYGCRSGLCGADAVLVQAGAAHLTPAGPDEIATLRRLGLAGQARLACMCQVSGPVVIDRNARAAEPDDRQMRPAAPSLDRAAERGIGRVVIVGNGVAGTSAAVALRRHSATVAIEIVTDEPLHFYNRMAVARLIHGRSGMDGMQLMPDAWFEGNRVAVARNLVAIAIDRERRSLLLATGERLDYDRLVLATGARPVLPDPAFLDHANAFVLRSAEDAQSLRRHVQRSGARRAAVIGGGVLGVEAAIALHHLGLDAVLLQRAGRLMARQLDAEGAARLAAHLQATGIQVVCGATIDRFESEEGTLRAAWLAHGPRVRADLFLACPGVQPNVALAQAAGLDVGRGIRVDATMQTSDPAILAIGDAAELVGAASGLWPVGVAQAEAAVATILGRIAPYRDPRPVLQLKSDGIDVRSFGRIEPLAGDEVYCANPGDDAWWRMLVRDGTLAGALYVGPPRTAGPFTRAIQRGIDVAPLRLDLLRGDLSALAAA